MDEMVLFLDYKCYPVFMYDTNEGGCTENALPENFPNREFLNVLFTDIQKQYDTFFTDTPTLFCYNGPQNKEEARAFNAKIDIAVAALMKANNGLYHIENRILKV